MPAIEVRDLTIAYGGTTAVDGLSFEARAGLVTALLGPNGAGKTSTVEALEGYRRPSSGTVRVLGLDPVAALQHPLDRSLQVVVADPCRHPTKHVERPDMPIQEHLLGLVQIRPPERLARP